MKLTVRKLSLGIFLGLLSGVPGLAAVPSDAEIVEFVVQKANLFATMGDYVQKSGFSEKRQKSLSEFLTKRGLTGAKMPGFSIGSSATEIQMAYPFQEPVKFTFSSKPKVQAKVGTRVIELQGKDVESIHRDLQNALFTQSKKKSAFHRLVDTLLPKAEAHPLLLVVGGGILLQTLIDQAFYCHSSVGTSEQLRRLDSCQLKSHADVIGFYKEAGILDGYTCHDGKLVTYTSYGHPVEVGVDSYGEVATLSETLPWAEDSSPCVYEIEDYSVKKLKSGPCIDQLSVFFNLERPKKYNFLPLKQMVRCCKTRKCRRESGALVAAPNSPSGNPGVNSGQPTRGADKTTAQ